MFPPRRALLAALALLLARPTAPTTFLLDGLRDPAYVLVAEDAPGDLAPELAAQPKFLWADFCQMRVWWTYDT